MTSARHFLSLLLSFTPEAASRMSPVLEIENLNLSFAAQPVLRNFSMTLRAGERVVLRGPSGCGKSTLLRCILGFADTDAGSIRIFGETLNATTVWSLRKKLAYVPQEPELGDGCGRDMLEQPFHYHANRHLRDRLKEIPNLLDKLGLASAVLDKDLRSLSGGEKQRLALAGALLLGRSLLLLDEVTSALDPENKQRVAALLAEVPDLTVLAVSHTAEGWGVHARTVTLESSP